jgi:hypothetical protein
MSDVRFQVCSICALPILTPEIKFPDPEYSGQI